MATTHKISKSGGKGFKEGFYAVVLGAIATWIVMTLRSKGWAVWGPEMDTEAKVFAFGALMGLAKMVRDTAKHRWGLDLGSIVNKIFPPIVMMATMTIGALILTGCTTTITKEKSPQWAVLEDGSVVQGPDVVLIQQELEVDGDDISSMMELILDYLAARPVPVQKAETAPKRTTAIGEIVIGEE